MTPILDRTERMPRAAVWSIALICVAATACAGPDSSLTPNPLVTLQVNWRTDIADKGFFDNNPREMSRVSMSRDGRTAFVGTAEGLIVAVDNSGGAVLWEVPLNDAVDGSPLSVRETVFIGGADGFMYALDSATGQLRWSFEAGGNLDSTPAASANHLIFANGIGTIMSLDRATGQLQWSLPDNDPILSVQRTLHPPIKGQTSPLIRDDRVYVGFPSGRLSALNVNTGAVIWTADLAGESRRHTDVDEPPVWIDGRLYVSSFTGGLYALNPETGRVIWRRELQGATRPVRYGDHLLTTTVDGRFHSLNMSDGRSQFSIQLEDRAPGQIQLMTHYAIVPTTRGALYVLDASVPYIHARYSTSNGYASAAIAPGGRIVAFDNEGILHGLTLRLR